MAIICASAVEMSPAITQESAMQVLYTANATATGGRDGRATSSDKALDVALSTPKQLGGAGGDGSNPEQLFAAGYAACFLSAMKLVGGALKIPVPLAASVSAQVGIGPNGMGGFGLAVSLSVRTAGMDQAAAEAVVAKAHEVCPYSNATRGNIAVTIRVNPEQI
jgi:osmotically inducible protein OsmC